MHRAIRTSFDSVWAEGCVVEPGPGGPPPGRRFRHFARAAWKAGASGLVPGGRVNSTAPPALGSGKFGTPLARMHLENASGPDAWLATGVVDPEVLAPPPAVAPDPVLAAALALPASDAEVLELPALAPQPATSTPERTAAAPSMRARLERVSLWS
jgi:hypothetical protein